MIKISLAEGKRISFEIIGVKDSKVYFRMDEIDEAIKWMKRKHRFRVVNSSSINHPEEYGFNKMFSATEWFKIVWEKSIECLELSKKDSIGKITLELKKFVDGKKNFPVKILFPNGHSIILLEKDEFILFWNGFRFGSSFKYFMDQLWRNQKSNFSGNRIEI